MTLLRWLRNTPRIVLRAFISGSRQALIPYCRVLRPHRRGNSLSPLLRLKIAASSDTDSRLTRLFDRGESMKFRTAILDSIALLAMATSQGAGAATLNIYFIDVEGGQSTLLLTPAGESLLIDAGWAGNGAPGSAPGDPAQSRDANRILAAARDAGINQIDYALITHFHADHDGGVPELAKLMPIRHFIDHGSLPVEAQRDAETKATFEAYLAVRNKVAHIEPKPGDQLPMKDIEAIVVSAAGKTLLKPLAGAGQVNAKCAGSAALPPGDAIENPRSTGILVKFGQFRFLNVGDLIGEPLFNLSCPKSLIGSVDVYEVTHHGGADNANPAIFAAFAPRVAIMNNGLKKGGALGTYEALHHVSGLEDVWQLHRSEAAGGKNFAVERIANLDERTAHWLKLSANEDGSFRVLNGRTGKWKNYSARSARAAGTLQAAGSL
jgi:competence protein ComEC